MRKIFTVSVIIFVCVICISPYPAWGLTKQQEEYLDYLIDDGLIPLYIKEKGQFGFIDRSDTNFSSVIRITGDSVRLRSQPNTEARVIQAANTGDWFDYAGEWINPQGEKWVVLAYEKAEGRIIEVAWVYGQYAEYLTNQQWAAVQEQRNRPAARLSDAEYKRMLNDCPEFADAEKHLNDTWKVLQQISNPQNMQEYRKDQINWITNTRQESVNAMLTSRNIDLVPSAALRNNKVDKDLAFAVVTKERALWLDELVKQEKDPAYLTTITPAQISQSASTNVQSFEETVSSAAQPIPAEVVVDRAFVRETHDAQAKRVATLEEGDGLRLLEEWKGTDPYPWYRIITDSGEGWIYGQVIRRLDEGRSPEATRQTAKQETPAVNNLQTGIIGSDENYVTVVVTGQGLERSEALEQAWIEAVRLAVGAIISSRSELNNDDLAESTIAHSRGVIESFDILDEKSEGNRVTVTIQAKVHKEILVDAAKTWAETQTVKAETGEAVKMFMDDNAKTTTAMDMQTSGSALLREVLEKHTIGTFYSATLDPKIYFDNISQKPYLKITEQFNNDVFWKEFLPKLREALEGIAAKKEKKFYLDAVQTVNRALDKDGAIKDGGLFGYNNKLHSADMPYSWSMSRMSDYVTFPRGDFMDGQANGSFAFVIIPDNVSSYTVYFLPISLRSFEVDLRGMEDFKAQILRDDIFIKGDISTKQQYNMFLDYISEMSSSVAFYFTFLDADGNEIYSQVVQNRPPFPAIYRSLERDGDYGRISFRVIAFAPGYVKYSPLYGTGPLFPMDVFIDSKGSELEVPIELDANNLQKIDRIKMELIF